VTKTRQEHVHRTAAHFDHLSAQYDHYAQKRRDYLEQIDRAMMRVVGRHDPCTFLDIGCGTGRLLGKLRNAFPDSTGVGVDVSAQMVDICLSRGLPAAQADFIEYRPARRVDVLLFEFNVFGYLIVQNGLRATLDHTLRLVKENGSIVFDILNPLCVTYARLRDTVPAALRRYARLRTNGEVVEFQYSIGNNPITMGLTRVQRIVKFYQDAGYRVRRRLVKYADHSWIRPLPPLLTSHYLLHVAPK
jgi:SAM-dependent methyltransferase